MRIPATMVAAVAFMGAAPPQQFDLICSGTAVTEDANGTMEHGDVHLRVDLKARKWCEDISVENAAKYHMTSCSIIHDIAEVQPGVIWFEKESPEEEAQGRMHSRSVDRQTGSYLYFHDLRILDRTDRIAIASQCESAPFSGFPEIKTKF